MEHTQDTESSSAPQHFNHVSAKYILLTIVLFIAVGLIWYITTLGKFTGNEPKETPNQQKSEQTVTLSPDRFDSFDAGVVGKELDTAAQNMNTVDPLENL